VQHTAYASEQLLVDHFIEQVGSSGSPWGELRLSTEFDYQRGRTDVVALTAGGMVLAFEAKLTRWRDALHQAYRNLCFAHRSFVVLPRAAAERASRFPREFSRRNVGLCYVENGEIVVLLAPGHSDPVLPWLSERATEFVTSGAS
jgi:hypothetical protein